MALVELAIPPLPAHVRTARLVVVAAARRAGLDDENVDELRLAVGEACARAVALHALHSPGVQVTLTVRDDPAGLTVAVHDCGPQAGPALHDLGEELLEAEPSAPGEPGVDLVDPDVSLALITALVDDVKVEAAADGTTVTLRWPLRFRLPPGVAGP